MPTTVITVTTPRGPIEFVPRDFTRWPRNAPSPPMEEELLRGMTVHWPGSLEAKRYAAATTPSKVHQVDEERVGFSIREHNSRRDPDTGRLLMSDVGYCYLIGRGGRVYEGRGWCKNGANGPILNTIRGQYPAGTKNTNPWWVSVQVVAGTDLQDVTPVQLEALERLYTWIVWRAGIRDPKVNGHRDVRATGCPGDVIHARLPQVQAAWPVITTIPTPDQETPMPDDNVYPSKVFRPNDGDLAQFSVTGGVARWITSSTERRELDFIGQTQMGSLIACDRELLKRFVLVGPAPEYGPGYTGPRTTVDDFGAHV